MSMQDDIDYDNRKFDLNAPTPAQQFLFAYDEMRRHQKDFFHSRSQTALQESKKWEKEADRLRKQLNLNTLF